MGKWIARVLVGIVVLAAVVVAGDWLVWLVRGRPLGSVHVSRVVVAPLKGGKEEYYADGEMDVDCSRSLVPLAGAGACWWVEGHRTVEER